MYEPCFYATFRSILAYRVLVAEEARFYHIEKKKETLHEKEKA